MPRWCWARATTSASAGFRQVIIGLSGGIDSALTAVHRRRRCRAGKCDRRRHARPVFVAGLDRRRPRSRRESGHSLRAALHQRHLRELQENSAEGIRRPQRGCDRREHSVPGPRHVADGALQQVRRHRAQHRQQERTGRGLLHALRRHGRRAGGDLGCAQDHGLPPEPLREFASRR